MTVSLKLPSLIAHRGASMYAPENTLTALRRARALGAEWVELDARLTHDGEVVIFHDDDLSRVGSRLDKVEDMDFADLHQVDVGSWFNKQFAAERIPTLTQYLQCAAELGLGINIDLKGTEARATSLVQAVAQQLKRDWSSTLPLPLVSSESEVCLYAVKQYLGHCWRGYILPVWREDWHERLSTFHCVSLHIHHRELTPERVYAVKAAGFNLLAYTVNDPLLARSLLSMGVDALFSDDPLLFQKRVD